MVNGNGNMMGPVHRLDLIIERTLLNGGDVEVVPDRFLKDHGRIAMMDINYDEIFNYMVIEQPDRKDIF